MMSLTLIIVELLCSAFMALAYPNHGRSLQARTVSPDNTCGGTNGYICPGSLPCCSQYGWCGSTDAYCGSGCQITFGTCSAGGSTTSGTSSTASVSSSTLQSSSTQQQSSSSTSTSSSISPTGVISPDNTCGGTNGYICPSSLPCCSQYGWCGSTDAYCGSGCQIAFGTCSAGGSTTSSTASVSSSTLQSSSTQQQSSSSTSTSSSTSPTGVISPNNTCGGTNGYICPSSLPCCSQYGWCGSTDAYCGSGCQITFGTCSAGGSTTSGTSSTASVSSSTLQSSSTQQQSSSSTSTSSSTSPTGVISPDNTCGGTNGYICPSSLPCCSQYGWCGSTDAYCGSGCQSAFGTCGGVSSSSSSTGSPTGSSTSTGPTSTPTNPTANIPRPLIGSVPYGQTITSCVTEGDMALTFDDGPYIYTSDLLDTLDAAGVKATFFIVGNNGNGAIDQVPAWTSVIQRMYNEGHQVASHTWDHPDLTTLTSDARKEEMYQNEAAFSNIIGAFPTYMRPPYLAFDNNCPQCGPDMVDLGYHVISTNLDTKDYENDDPTLIQNSKNTFASYTALSPSSNNYIVLNHDIHYQTVYNLTAYEIQRATATGYRLVTVGECLGDPAANWYRAAPPAAAARPAPLVTAQNFKPPSNVCTFVEDPANLKAVPLVVANSTTAARLNKRAKLKRNMMSDVRVR